MARLKLGSGLNFEAELPQIDTSSPKIGPAVIEQPQSNYDNELLNLKIKFEQNATDLQFSKQIVTQKIEEFLERQDLLSTAIDHLHVKLEDYKSEIIIPEVKHITNIKDVSPEVIKKCEDIGLKIEQKYDILISGLKQENKKQTLVNKILAGLLILSIFLHLI